MDSIPVFTLCAYVVVCNVITAVYSLPTHSHANFPHYFYKSKETV